jgi:hypothetical protein
MKKIFLFAALLFSAVSCMKNDGPNQKWERTLDAIATTVNTSANTKFQDQIEVTVIQDNVTKSSLSFELKGIQFVQMMPSVNFMLKDVPFKLYDHKGDDTDPLKGSWVFNEAEVVPQAGGVDRTDYTMHNVKGNFSDAGLKLEFDVHIMNAVFHATIDTSVEIEEEGK